MTWYGWLLLMGVGLGIGILMHFLYDDKSGAVPCCGCGQCIATGKCVMRRRKREEKTGKTRLDK